MDERLKFDANKEKVMGGVTNDANLEIRNIRVDPVTNRLLVSTDADEGLNGTGQDGSVTLTSANTWLQIPNTIPTNKYVLCVTKESETGTIRWSFDNDGVPSSTNGNKMLSDEITFVLGASEVIYFGSDDATDIVNWTTKEID